MPIYVNMIDKSLSGWGPATNGRSLYCIRCETDAQAKAIFREAKTRSEMKRIAISDRPLKERHGDVLTVRHFDELGGYWHHYYQGE